MSLPKGLPVDLKIPEWGKLYNCDACVELHGEVEDKVAVVVDDLYQSGAPLWCYASYLKKLGAKYVFGLSCVKSLKDTDNQ